MPTGDGEARICCHFPSLHGVGSPRDAQAMTDSTHRNQRSVRRHYRLSLSAPFSFAVIVVVVVVVVCVGFTPSPVAGLNTCEEVSSCAECVYDPTNGLLPPDLRCGWCASTDSCRTITDDVLEQYYTKGNTTFINAFCANLLEKDHMTRTMSTAASSALSFSSPGERPQALAVERLQCPDMSCAAAHTTNNIYFCRGGSIAVLVFALLLVLLNAAYFIWMRAVRQLPWRFEPWLSDSIKGRAPIHHEHHHYEHEHGEERGDDQPRHPSRGIGWDAMPQGALQKSKQRAAERAVAAGRSTTTAGDLHALRNRMIRRGGVCPNCKCLQASTLGPGEVCCWCDIARLSFVPFFLGFWVSVITVMLIFSFSLKPWFADFYFTIILLLAYGVYLLLMVKVVLGRRRAIRAFPVEQYRVVDEGERRGEDYGGGSDGEGGDGGVALRERDLPRPPPKSGTTTTTTANSDRRGGSVREERRMETMTRREYDLWCAWNRVQGILRRTAYLELAFRHLYGRRIEKAFPTLRHFTAHYGGCGCSNVFHSIYSPEPAHGLGLSRAAPPPPTAPPETADAGSGGGAVAATAASAHQRAGTGVGDGSSGLWRKQAYKTRTTQHSYGEGGGGDAEGRRGRPYFSEDEGVEPSTSAERVAWHQRRRESVLRQEQREAQRQREVGSVVVPSRVSPSSSLQQRPPVSRGGREGQADGGSGYAEDELAEEQPPCPLPRAASSSSTPSTSLPPLGNRDNAQETNELIAATMAQASKHSGFMGKDFAPEDSVVLPGLAAVAAADRCGGGGGGGHDGEDGDRSRHNILSARFNLSGTTSGTQPSSPICTTEGFVEDHTSIPAGTQQLPSQHPHRGPYLLVSAVRDTTGASSPTPPPPVPPDTSRHVVIVPGTATITTTTAGVTSSQSTWRRDANRPAHTPGDAAADAERTREAGLARRGGGEKEEEEGVVVGDGRDDAATTTATALTSAPQSPGGASHVSPQRWQQQQQPVGGGHHWHAIPEHLLNQKRAETTQLLNTDLLGGHRLRKSLQQTLYRDEIILWYSKPRTYAVVQDNAWLLVDLFAGLLVGVWLIMLSSLSDRSYAIVRLSGSASVGVCGILCLVSFFLLLVMTVRGLSSLYLLTNERLINVCEGILSPVINTTEVASVRHATMYGYPPSTLLSFLGIHNEPSLCFSWEVPAVQRKLPPIKSHNFQGLTNVHEFLMYFRLVAPKKLHGGNVAAAAVAPLTPLPLPTTAAAAAAASACPPVELPSSPPPAPINLAMEQQRVSWRVHMFICSAFLIALPLIIIYPVAVPMSSSLFLFLTLLLVLLAALLRGLRVQQVTYAPLNLADEWIARIGGRSAASFSSSSPPPPTSHPPASPPPATAASSTLSHEQEEGDTDVNANHRGMARITKKEASVPGSGGGSSSSARGEPATAAAVIVVADDRMHSEGLVRGCSPPDQHIPPRLEKKDTPDEEEMQFVGKGGVDGGGGDDTAITVLHHPPHYHHHHRHHHRHSPNESFSSPFPTRQATTASTSPHSSPTMWSPTSSTEQRSQQPNRRSGAPLSTGLASTSSGDLACVVAAASADPPPLGTTWGSAVV